MFTVEELREKLEYRPDTGELIWKTKARGRAQGSIAGNTTRGKCPYRQITFAGTRQLAHRLIWFHVHGHWPVNQIDHINGDSLDNRLCNLRDVPAGKNLVNRPKLRTNSTGFTGVQWRRDCKKWTAGLIHDGRYRYLGSFDTAEDAGAAYQAAAVALRGEGFRNFA